MNDARFDSRLPDELLKAPLEFDRWSQTQLKREERASTPREPLYHYTGEQAAKGILKNQHLWCFSHLHQKDPNEFSFSLDVARRVIRDVRNSDDYNTYEFCDCLDDLLETNCLAGPFDFYLSSLSQLRDDEDQWRDYGDDGRGFAIGFAPKLFLPTQRVLNDKPNENLHVGRIIYGEERTAARHRTVVEHAARISSRIATRYPSLLQKVPKSLYLVTTAREVLASQLVWNCLTAKEFKFQREYETRFISMGVKEKFDGVRKTLPGTKRVYVEAPLPLKQAGSIVEILVGPLAPVGAERMIEEFLKTEGYSYAISIRRSVIPYLSNA